jgi:hypothetical protein
MIKKMEYNMKKTVKEFKKWSEKKEAKIKDSNGS